MNEPKETAAPQPTPQPKTNNIEHLYGNVTYLDNYVLQIILVILVTLITFLIVSYSYINIHMAAIKDDWPNQRCKPYVIPFAGLIYKQDPTMSASDATKQNMDYCTQNTLKEISADALAPLTFAINNLNSVANGTDAGINSSRGMFDKMRTNMQDVSEEIMGRLLNITVPIQQIVISFKDMLSKVQGVMTSALFTSLGTYYTLQSFLGAVAELLLKCLIALAAMIVVMWLVPFTWGMASAMTAVFIGISIPMALILAFMSETMHVNVGLGIPRLPKKPACFAGDMLLPVRVDGGDGATASATAVMEIPIKDVKVGDVLAVDGSKVTAKISLCSAGQTMYRLGDGVIVSGTHIVRYGDAAIAERADQMPRGWVYVRDHPQAQKVEDWMGDTIYCLNCSSKRIVAGGKIFCDWDEILTNSQEILLREKMQDRFRGLRNSVWDGNVGDLTHKHLDRVVKYGSRVLLESGIGVPIESLKLGSHLASDGGQIAAPNIVYGIVELEEEGRQTGLHLLTTEGYFIVVVIEDSTSTIYKEIKTYDYNSCLDAFIV